MAITSNIKATLNFYKSINKQILFAGGLALNDTSIMATKNVQNELQSTFDITTSWARAGNALGPRKTKPQKTKTDVFQFVGITKGGSVNKLRGSIPSLGKDHWIYDHEKGATRTPIKGKDILIPTELMKDKYGSMKGKKGRRKVNQILGNGNRDRRDSNGKEKTKGYYIFDANIKGNDYIMGRENKKVNGKRFAKTPTGRTSKKKAKVYQRIIPLFLIKKQVKIKDEFNFEETVNNTYKTHFKKNFHKRFKQAVSTMHIKG